MISIMFSPDRLRAARKQANRTQSEAASAAGSDVRSIRNWETGAYPPSSDVLASLAGLYGVAPGEFFVTGSDASESPAANGRSATTQAPLASSARESANGAR